VHFPETALRSRRLDSFRGLFRMRVYA